MVNYSPVLNQQNPSFDPFYPQGQGQGDPLPWHLTLVPTCREKCPMVHPSIFPVQARHGQKPVTRNLGLGTLYNQTKLDL